MPLLDFTSETEYLTAFRGPSVRQRAEYAGKVGRFYDDAGKIEAQVAAGGQPSEWEKVLQSDSYARRQFLKRYRAISEKCTRRMAETKNDWTIQIWSHNYVFFVPLFSTNGTVDSKTKVYVWWWCWLEKYEAQYELLRTFGIGQHSM